MGGEGGSNFSNDFFSRLRYFEQALTLYFVYMSLCCLLYSFLLTSAAWYLHRVGQTCACNCPRAVNFRFSETQVSVFAHRDSFQSVPNLTMFQTQRVFVGGLTMSLWRLHLSGASLQQTARRIMEAAWPAPGCRRMTFQSNHCHVRFKMSFPRTTFTEFKFRNSISVWKLTVCICHS